MGAALAAIADDRDSRALERGHVRVFVAVDPRLIVHFEGFPFAQKKTPRSGGERGVWVSGLSTLTQPVTAPLGVLISTIVSRVGRTSTNDAVKVFTIEFELRFTLYPKNRRDQVWDPIRRFLCCNAAGSAREKEHFTRNFPLFTAVLLCFSAEIVSKRQHA